MKKQKQATPIEVGPLANYPDVLSVKELRQILRIGKLGAYKLLGSGIIHSFKIGNVYKIPKDSVIAYMNQACNLNEKGEQSK